MKITDGVVSPNPRQADDRIEIRITATVTCYTNKSSYHNFKMKK